MKAIILATGTASGGPLAHFVPAALMPLGNKPLLEHQLELLVRSEVREVIVILNQLPHEIERYLGNGQRWGVEIDYRLEQNPHSWAALRRAAAGLKEPFWVLHEGVIADIDLRPFRDFHQEHQALLTVGLGRPAVDNEAAYVRLDEQGRVVGTGGPADRVDVGIWLCEPAFLERIAPFPEAGPDFDQWLQMLSRGNSIYGFYVTGFWRRLFKNNDWLQMNEVLLKGGAGRLCPAGRQVAPAIWVGHHTVIHPTARLEGPVAVGEDCRIGPDVVLGPGAMVGSGVIVDRGATIVRSLVFAGTYVGRWVNLMEALVYRNLLIKASTGISIFVPDAIFLNGIMPEAIGVTLRFWVERLGILCLFLLSLPFWPLALGLSLMAGTGPLLEPLHQAVMDWRSLRETGHAGWRPALLYRFRADPATWAGRWLSRLGLDGLPLLVGALFGYLAPVGVGPLTPEQAAHLHEEWQQLHFHAPAGLTGLWYLNGDGHRPYHLEEQLIADGYYVATRNWLEDWRILSLTPQAWWRRLWQPGAGGARRESIKSADSSTESLGLNE